jgi:hypothetical protein
MFSLLDDRVSCVFNSVLSTTEFSTKNVVSEISFCDDSFKSFGSQQSAVSRLLSGEKRICGWNRDPQEMNLYNIRNIIVSKNMFSHTTLRYCFICISYTIGQRGGPCFRATGAGPHQYLMLNV